MTTWTSKGAIAAFLLITLAACEDGQGGMLGALSNATKAAAPLSQVSMASGAVNLVAPDGFCIDKRSLKAHFAMLARCDTLNAATSDGGAPLGIITVTVSPQSNAQSSLPTPEQTAAASGLSDLSGVTKGDNAVTFRASGPPLSDELNARHWRGTARVGGKVVGLAFYAPIGGRGTTGEGRVVLTDLIARSQGRS